MSRFAWDWRASHSAALAALDCTWTTQGQPVLGGRIFRSCVGNTTVDHMSKYIEEAGGYFTSTLAVELGAWRLCPPSSPFVIDVGLNLGSFAFMALQLGCHVASNRCSRFIAEGSGLLHVCTRALAAPLPNARALPPSRLPTPRRLRSSLC